MSDTELDSGAGAQRFTARALAGHSAVGLTLAAAIYLICFTGTLAVFSDELKYVEQPSPSVAVPHPGALNRAVNDVLAQAPETARIYALAPQTASGRLTIDAYGADGHRSWLADAAGNVAPAQTSWSDFVDDLHMNLTAPAPWGSIAVGLVGVALLSLLISGIIAHPRIFRDAFHLRLGSRKRLREADLHNRLSVWGLPFHIAVTATGAFFGVADLVVMAIAAIGFQGNAERVYQSIEGPEVAADSRPAPLPDLEAIIAHARAALPGSNLSYIGVERPGTAGTRIEAEITGPGRLPRGDQIFFDAHGAEIGRTGFVTGAVGLQLYSGAAQVHFGFWGGLPVRIAYGILGAALTWISASGIHIWLARRRDQGRAVPRLERAWRAWTWGVPLALLAAWFGGRLIGVAPCFWSTLALAQLAAQFHPARAPAAGARTTPQHAPGE